MIAQSITSCWASGSATSPITPRTGSGSIAGSGGLVKTGTGTLTLAGANSYTGVTTLLAGGLVLDGGQALADASTVQLADAAGAEDGEIDHPSSAVGGPPSYRGSPRPRTHRCDEEPSPRLKRRAS